jgi:hypothetical protein
MNLIIKKIEELITIFLETLFIIVKTVRIKYPFYFKNCSFRYVAINCKALPNNNTYNENHNENNIQNNNNAAITS